ncbi:hypothetical protein ACIF6L_31480 [Kitasatospora sp. NPDC086009]|uniref:hypothetical protein n=1 Tax=unclassified Kitasatospora TaxID=2633591 RepID=UPI0037C75387
MGGGEGEDVLGRAAHRAKVWTALGHPSWPAAGEDQHGGPDVLDRGAQPLGEFPGACRVDRADLLLVVGQSGGTMPGPLFRAGGAGPRAERSMPSAGPLQQRY